ncbi:cyclopropane-fatty-acyl-phospholipid synthase [Thioclava dalianensis]|uniref:Cyclopropane-fatty-acyl-phospholipid synthase n=1 Tax=Thioclava dalianensis TaxID=1185766 RepID=A0A074U2M1_9RHOB|nr:DUF1365 domain-containing protein [Thioclava dalianensis]KEP68902.1 cyclopropane-fatty-acyl-phospholipid synthase [Thioclava dalianensis]SFN35736.1 hypothetical protein SAMN05216224_104276 [Thioclava dalianensis]
MTVEFCPGSTTHARRGAIKHSFRYHVDFVLIDPESAGPWPWLFSRNSWDLAVVRDRDHGGTRGQGSGAAWAREKLAEAGAPAPDHLRLLTQPRIFGAGFNPVSFWLSFDAAGELRAVIAEVNNTFGDRHSYLCATPDFDPISAQTVLETRKIFHVSPFQDIAGGYRFQFKVTPQAIQIRITHENGDEGVIATLVTSRSALRNRDLIAIALRRPLTPIRTMSLILWQALRLRLKGAVYRARPTPPNEEIS